MNIHLRNLQWPIPSPRRANGSLLPVLFATMVHVITAGAKAVGVIAENDAPPATAMESAVGGDQCAGGIGGR